jgi:hypothetical protein
MPKGTKVVSAEPAGNSAWTTTGKITVTLPDGTSKGYFLKVGTIFCCVTCSLVPDNLVVRAWRRGVGHDAGRIQLNVAHP